ncbi:MAG: sulfatase-like hydrolase/transferase [Planctomycetes bacterium]|nr:sulfatase-like hydrolase/transferase [Planctomycetota bacterium]
MTTPRCAIRGARAGARGVLTGALASVLCVALVACGDAASGADDGAATDATSPATGAATSDVDAPGDAWPLRGALAGDDCVLILLDALHADHLGVWGGPPEVAPRLDALARDGVRVAHAWSPASWTLPSTTSLFTSLFQETHGLQFSVVEDPAVLATKRLSADATTMAELFSAAGYATTCYTQNPWTARSYGLDQGFDAYNEIRGDRDSQQGWKMAGDIVDLLSAPREKPRFVYAHFRRPHTPFDPPSDVLEQFTDPDYDGPILGTDEDVEAHNSNRRRMTEADARQHLGRYEANIHQADLCVGRILDGIDLEHTLVVVVSDHGEAVGQHGRYGHNWRSYEEYVHVPIILDHPRLPHGLVLDGLISTLDVLPTLADLFSLPLDRAAVQGESLLPELCGGPPPKREVLFTSARLDGRGERHMAAFDGRFKYVRQHPSGREWLYDLQTDPGEQHDVLAEQPEVTQRLRAALGAWFGGQKARFVDETLPEGLDEAQIEELKRLGYLGGDAETGPAGDDDDEGGR